MTEHPEPGRAPVAGLGGTGATADIATVAELARSLRQLRRREARQRGDAELTYRELAAKTGWSVGIIAQYLTGKVLPPTDRFDVLVQLLGGTRAEQSALATARDRVEEYRRTPPRPAREARAGRSAGVERAERVVPRQLPAAVRHFAGRTRELEVLTGLADQAAGGGGAVIITAIDGTPGIGKTALAVSWAHRVAGRFPDGQLYINLRGFDPAGTPMPPAEAVRHFLDALQVPPQRIPAGLDAQAGLVRSLLAGRRMLLVLDNARDEQQVRPLLPGSAGCLAVITSRNRLTGLITAEGARPITLDLLSQADARHLLAERLGPSRAAADPAALDEIAERCARLPLALSIVAARAAARPAFPAGALAAELRDTQDGLDRFDSGDPATDVRSVFSWSYRALHPAAARLFRLLGLQPGAHITTLAAASLGGLNPRQARRSLGALAQAHLVAEPAPGRFTLHDLLRAYASELVAEVDPPADRRAATRRLLDHYAHTACTADRLLYPHGEPIPLPLSAPAPGTSLEHLANPGAAMAWLTTQHPVLLAAAGNAAETGFDTLAWQLAWALHTYLDRQGHRHDCAAAWQVALGAADRLGDSRAQAYAYRRLGHAHTRLGRDDEARGHLQRALEQYVRLDDRVSQAYTHYNLSYLAERQGRPRRALEHAEQALALFRAVGHRRGEAGILNGVGWCHALLGDYAAAITHCEQALALLVELGDRESQANTWDSIGYAHHHLGDHARATDCYRHALDLFRDLGDRYEEADVLGHLGETQHAAGDPDAARTTWTQALEVLTDLDHPDAEGVRARLRALEQ